MCRFFGMMSNTSVSMGYPLIDAPHSLMHQASCARIAGGIDCFGEHNDGCGVAWQKNADQGRELGLTVRGREGCWDASFRDLVRGLSTTGLIAHNRRATGSLAIGESLAHPFRGMIGDEEIAFCHNGTIYSLLDEARSQGITDSQLFLGELTTSLTTLNSHNLSEFLKSCSASWDFSSINGVILSSDTLYAWRCFNELRDGIEARAWYYSLLTKTTKNSVQIASEAIDSEPGWEALANRTLVTIRRSTAERPDISICRF